MLKNDPPPGTRVKFLQEVRKARANDIGKLVRPLGTYLTERATDEFEIEYRGERITVTRSQITEAENEAEV
jgi:hypothetical protein